MNDGDLEARARDVAQFLGIDPEQLVRQALQAAGNDGARDALVSTLQNATADRRKSLADDQTKAEHDATFSDNTGSKVFFAIDQELLRLSTNADGIIDNPLVDWLKRLRRDANAKIAYILNLFAYNEMKIRAGVVGDGLATHVLNPLVAAGKRVHLVGHSFGGRLMTAATAAVEGKISNLTDCHCAQRSRRGGLDRLSIGVAGLPRHLFASAGGSARKGVRRSDGSLRCYRRERPPESN